MIDFVLLLYGVYILILARMITDDDHPIIRMIGWEREISGIFEIFRRVTILVWRENLSAYKNLSFLKIIQGAEHEHLPGKNKYRIGFEAILAPKR